MAAIDFHRYAAEVGICYSTVVVVPQGSVRVNDVTILDIGELKLVSRGVLRVRDFFSANQQKKVPTFQAQSSSASPSTLMLSTSLSVLAVLSGAEPEIVGRPNVTAMLSARAGCWTELTSNSLS